MRAILSVYDKSGLLNFAQGLSRLKFELYSTGGTQKSLAEGKVPVQSISKLTGFPEILDGRVKTLHPMVHGGILARRSLPAHMEELARNKIGLIDLVAVNLYPFVQTVSKPGVSLEDALENIDIGGPTMIRASAKNYPDVIIVVDPADYDMVLEKLAKGQVDQDLRKKLAQKAFQHTASYDTAISQYLRQDEAGFPPAMTVALSKRYDLRYGENPHQKAAFYAEEVPGPSKGTTLASAKQLWGKELSHNNILDADAAWQVVCDFSAPTVAVIKHTNPCGLASNASLAEAYKSAFSGDPVSAFGGIVALNRSVNGETASAMQDVFYEIVIAPGFDEDALSLLKQKKDLRILDMGRERPAPRGLEFRRVGGGFLVQTPDNYPDDQISLRTVTKRAPSAEELKNLLFAWKAAKHVKSNAIVLAKDSVLVGMGAGQPNRVTSVHLALRAAGEKSKGSVVGSDAFFPFPDGVELAGKGGATAIIQPGGSIRDTEAIAMADRYNMAMVFTGIRHFKH